ncbi:VOC family protein [Candidatus Uabimicrobium sp. HlEnr_7]|uniref:VOC family protein n=1 Tax=Candidatus Uabimicrobium helgolandensis TaxID=3095367 RepID=UPI0035561CA5
MITKNTKIRIARPTDNLAQVAQMYVDGLGFEIIAQFENHQGFDGVMVGHREHLYHLEFTHHRGTIVGKAPSHDNLLVFYIANSNEWEAQCSQMIEAGFREVKSYNPYWDTAGKTFSDIDEYRVVLQNREWEEN